MHGARSEPSKGLSIHLFKHIVVIGYILPNCTWILHEVSLHCSAVTVIINTVLAAFVLHDSALILTSVSFRLSVRPTVLVSPHLIIVGSSVHVGLHLIVVRTPVHVGPHPVHCSFRLSEVCDFRLIHLASFFGDTSSIENGLILPDKLLGGLALIGIATHSEHITTLTWRVLRPKAVIFLRGYGYRHLNVIVHDVVRLCQTALGDHFFDLRIGSPTLKGR